MTPHSQDPLLDIFMMGHRPEQPSCSGKSSLSAAMTYIVVNRVKPLKMSASIAMVGGGMRDLALAVVIGLDSLLHERENKYRIRLISYLDFNQYPQSCKLQPSLYGQKLESRTEPHSGV